MNFLRNAAALIVCVIVCGWIGYIGIFLFPAAVGRAWTLYWFTGNIVHLIALLMMISCAFLLVLLVFLGATSDREDDE